MDILSKGSSNKDCIGGQGGVATFWRNNIAGISKVSDIIHDRICALRLQIDDTRVFYFISVYLPAQGASEDLDASIDELSVIVNSIEEGAYFMGVSAPMTMSRSTEGELNLVDCFLSR